MLNVFVSVCIFPLICPEEFIDLKFGDSFKEWTTKGNLSTTLFRVLLDIPNPPPAIRICLTAENSPLKNPLTATIVRGKTVHSMSLSRVQWDNRKKFEYWYASDTLCDDIMPTEQLVHSVYISIANSDPTVFSIRVKPVKNFHIGSNQFEVHTSPPEPRYYLYTFPENVEKVNIRAFSDSSICGKLIARRVECPLFDRSGLVEQGEDYFFQSYTKFAGFPIKKSDIGSQFHLAVVVNPDDSICRNSLDLISDTTNNPHRVKISFISVTPDEENAVVSLIPLLVYAASISIVLVITFLNYKYLDSHENNEPDIFEGSDSEASVIIDKVDLFKEPNMIVSHQEYQKQRLVKDSKYFNFLFFQLFGSILPALTTLFQNRLQKANKTNLDTCYLNYRCSLNVIGFNSFNSMTSASSLAVLGIINLIIVFRKQIFRYEIPRFPTSRGIQQRDAPKIVCLLGLVALGVYSAILNNCQQKSMLQFYDYTILWLQYSALLWIYSKRHGVRKWQQLYIITVSSILGFISLSENMFVVDSSLRLIIKIVFSICSIGFTGYFAYKYFYERPSGLQSHQWICTPLSSQQKVLEDDKNVKRRPLNSKMSYVFISIGYAIICSIVTFLHSGISVHSAIYFSAKGQLVIYLFFYIIQKIRFEWSSFTFSYTIRCIFLIVFLVLFQTLNRYFANFASPFNFYESPALSRELNSECIIPGIDWNNVRHYNAVITCSFFILLLDYIDINIESVPKKIIFVF